MKEIRRRRRRRSSSRRRKSSLPTIRCRRASRKFTLPPFCSLSSSFIEPKIPLRPHVRSLVVRSDELVVSLAASHWLCGQRAVASHQKQQETSGAGRRALVPMGTEELVGERALALALALAQPVASAPPIESDRAKGDNNNDERPRRSNKKCEPGRDRPARSSSLCIALVL